MPRQKFYDGEDLFRTYCSWGEAATYPRLAQYANGTTPNPKTGVASMMGAVYAMKRWAFHNPEKAFEYWKEYQFNLHPEKTYTFEEFALELRHWGKNQNVAGKTDMHRFCAKYGIPMDYHIKSDDIVQVTRKDHALFQTLLIVDSVEESTLQAYSFSVSGRTNHQLSVRDVGVCGRVIV